MKILSYKILNEATVNLFNRNASALGGNFALGGGISRNLLKTTRMAKQRGIEGASDTLKLFTRFVQILFNFYETQGGNPALPTNLNVAFGLYFTNDGLIAHLIPYHSKSIQSIVRHVNTSTEYASLQLYDANNNNEPINIEQLINNFQQGGRYNFELIIPDVDRFRQINRQYQFVNLNQLEQFANTGGVNATYQIGLLQSSGFRNITLDRSQDTNNNQISFEVRLPQGAQQNPNITTINNIFNRPQNCNVIFNNAPRRRNLPQNLNLPRNITRINYGNREFIIIYTTNPIDSQTTPQTYTNSYFETNVTINQGQPPIQCDFVLTSFV